jgi:hypothetical protein
MMHPGFGATTIGCKTFGAQRELLKKQRLRSKPVTTPCNRRTEEVDFDIFDLDAWCHGWASRVFI